MKTLFLLIFSILVPAYGFSMGLSCDDPDVVFCLDINEGSGVAARDYGRIGLTGTLVGGPAWTLGSAATKQLTAYSTTTFTAMPGYYVTFTRTAGEEIVCPASAVLNFSGNKEFMTAITVKMDSMTGAVRTIWAYSDGSDSPSGGWQLRMDADHTVNFGFIGIADNAFTTKLFDLNPHTLGVWWDGNGTMLLFFDGKLDKTITGATDIASVVGMINIAKRTNGGHGEWGGGIQRARVWRKAVPRDQAEAFFSAYHNLPLNVNQGTQ